ncbi:MAG TPA: flagellar basal body P-ring formation chaperone FlgA [Dissulfurispiraceae bacterium]|nr:flagellar basal body P-ring formation chaperone FlgA [Dissulfurispiraceae bacterium]
MLTLIVACAVADAATLRDEVIGRLAEEVRSLVPGESELQNVQFLQGEELLSSNGIYGISSIGMTGYTGKQRVQYRLELTDRQGKKETVLADVTYDSLIELFVTAHALAKGSIVNETDFQAVRQRGSRMPSGAVLNRSEIVGKTVRINLSEGLVLKRDHFFVAGLVKRGTKVRIEIENESGLMLVSAKGILRSDGTVGSTVRVFCETSRKEVMGVLISRDTVKMRT